METFAVYGQNVMRQWSKPTSILLKSRCVTWKLVHALFPCSKVWNPRYTNVTIVNGGITNRIYCVSSSVTVPEAKVLVRQFGGFEVISESSRAEENRIFAQLSKQGIAPGLLGIFDNGRVERWLDARRVELDEMRSDYVLIGVAEAMADLHLFQTENKASTGNNVTVWNSISEWLGVASGLAISREFDVSLLSREVSELKHILLELLQPSPVVFAHNDLLAGNILVALDDVRKIHLIDFEYSSSNYRDFDIVNFFCEAMGGTADGFVDANKYPSRTSQFLFCRTYLTRTSAAKSCSSQPLEEDVDGLVQSANRYGLLAHLYWAAWALAQTGSSTIDFPYLVFARSRFRQYMQDKMRYISRWCGTNE